MAFGATPDDARLKAAWDVFCDRMKGASDIVFRDTAPATPLDRATGFQYLARYMEKAWRSKAEFYTLDRPELWTLQTPVSKSFGDNPDCNYLNTYVDGAKPYRLYGNRGTVDWVSFMADSEDREVRVSINNDALKTNDDGAFEIIVSPEEHAGNWLRTKPGRTYIFIRQFFGEWDAETPMTVHIEPRGAATAPPPPTPDDIISALERAGTWYVADTLRWVEWVEFYGDKPNEFVAKMPAWAGDGAQASLGRSLQFCQWRIQPDEALVIEVKPPAARYWNFELANFWFTSVDYRYRLSSLNHRQAVLDADGVVRVVVSHADPGVPNWLDTGGHTVGMINQRWFEVAEKPTPATRLVKLSRLLDALPRTSARIDEAGRREQLRRRKAGVDRRFPL